jgi:hypothetical protein
LRHIRRDDPSCQAAVARLNATPVAHGLAPCSPLIGGYCKAHQRLPETLLYRLVLLSGQRLQQLTPMAWHRHGWTVKRVDRPGVSKSDLETNQQEYTQPSSQKPGLGLPGARLVVVLWEIGVRLEFSESIRYIASTRALSQR